MRCYDDEARRIRIPLQWKNEWRAVGEMRLSRFEDSLDTAFQPNCADGLLVLNPGRRSPTQIAPQLLPNLRRRAPRSNQKISAS